MFLIKFETVSSSIVCRLVAGGRGGELPSLGEKFGRSVTLLRKKLVAFILLSCIPGYSDFLLQCRRGSRILKWGGGVTFCNNVIEPKPG